jgi:tetratricopeptide (TPR) repeat protein
MRLFLAVVTTLVLMAPALSADVGRAPRLTEETFQKKGHAKAARTRIARFQELKLRGQGLENEGQVEAALETYRAALMAWPDAALEGHMRRMVVERADKHRKQSDQIYLLALKATQQGNEARAREFCRDALSLDPGNIYAKCMLGRLEKSRRIIQAR